MKKATKLGLIGLGIASTSTALVMGMGSNYLVEYAIGRHSNADERNIDESSEVLLDEQLQNIITANKNQDLAAVREWEKDHTFNSEEITSFDNLKLAALSYLQENPTNKWVILVHGYRCDSTDMKDYALKYIQAGYNVLLPDNRGCGKSEGDYLGMGWLDKEDLKSWIDYLVSLTPDPSIIVHGHSMGAATTMMLAGDNPQYVDLYIEESGYTSVDDIFSLELDKRFNLPSFPLMNIADIISEAKAGYKFSEASSVEQLKKAKKPMLFIHGTNDDFVPFSMLDEVYNAKPGEKKKVVINGADHSGSRHLNPELYWSEVFNFINENTQK